MTPRPELSNDVDRGNLLIGVPADSLDATSPTRQVRPLLVTIPQAAAMLALGRSSVYELIGTGALTPVRIGRSVRISVAQLSAFVRQL